MNYVQYLSKHWKYCKFDATSEQRLLLSLERLASRKSNKAHLAKHKKLRHKGFLGINRPQLTTTWRYFRFIYKRPRSMTRKAIIKNAPKCQVRLGRGGQYGYCPPKMGHFCNDALPPSPHDDKCALIEMYINRIYSRSIVLFLTQKSVLQVLLRFSY